MLGATQETVTPSPRGKGGSHFDGERSVPDTNINATDSAITYANHVDTPIPMIDAQLDEVLREANLRAGRSDQPGDVACCVTMTRSGTAGEFGSPGDGLDIINDNEELVTQVMPLRYVQASEVKSQLEGLLSDQGTLMIEGTSNALVVRDFP